MPKNKAALEEAGMYRVEAGQVHRSRSGSVIEDRGRLRKASRAHSGSRWLFSESGAGTEDLVLLGTRQQIMIFLASKYDWRIENQIPDLPEIYMSVQEYKPGKRFKGLFPVGDAIMRITEAVASFAPGNELTDLAGILKDIVDLTQFNLTIGHSENDEPSNLGQELYVQFSYLPGDHMYQIASHSVDMRSIRVLLANMT